MGGKQGKSSKKFHSIELTEEEIMLLLSNTHFNRTQIEEWHNGFIVIFFCLIEILNNIIDILKKLE